ncbi:hypothetical protein BESB_084520 [Besnoitia besnoiti]|uniref:Translation initiation factor 3 N-terminal domain-containing protein n=1 Tax=Besnoitia besnoiti TaxID=94643 RepID=A0A2A9MC59_BESBE|nr:hypothetical protein BESB_084520 [Besnoitia besnoiti]PFH33253.1 hypothetical protein BESB_084520 [Besnoitia besnoiti]
MASRRAVDCRGAMPLSLSGEDSSASVSRLWRPLLSALQARPRPAARLFTSACRRPERLSSSSSPLELGLLASLASRRGFSAFSLSSLSLRSACRLRPASSSRPLTASRSSAASSLCSPASPFPPRGTAVPLSCCEPSCKRLSSLFPGSSCASVGCLSAPSGSPAAPSSSALSASSSAAPARAFSSCSALLRPRAIHRRLRDSAVGALRLSLSRPPTRSFASAVSRAQRQAEDARVHGNLFAEDIASLSVVRVLVEAAARSGEKATRRELLGDMSGADALAEAERRGLAAVVLAGSSAKLPVCLLTPSLQAFLAQQQRRQARARAFHVPPPFRETRRGAPESEEETHPEGAEGRRDSSDASGATAEGGAGGDTARRREAESARAREEDTGTFAFDPSLKVKTVRINGVADERDMLRSAQTAKKFLAQGHRVELHVVAQMHQKKTRARACHLVLLIGGFVRECRDVGRPVHLPLNASVLATQPIVKVQIWPCSKEQAAAFQMPPIILESPKKGKGDDDGRDDGKRGKGKGHERRGDARAGARQCDED